MFSRSDCRAAARSVMAPRCGMPTVRGTACRQLLIKGRCPTHGEPTGEVQPSCRTCGHFQPVGWTGKDAGRCHATQRDMRPDESCPDYRSRHAD